MEIKQKNMLVSVKIWDTFLCGSGAVGAVIIKWISYEELESEQSKCVDITLGGTERVNLQKSKKDTVHVLQADRQMNEWRTEQMKNSSTALLWII